MLECFKLFNVCVLIITFVTRAYIISIDLPSPDSLKHNSGDNRELGKVMSIVLNKCDKAMR